jgi:hypothetical protein
MKDKRNETCPFQKRIRAEIYYLKELTSRSMKSGGNEGHI